MVHNVDLLIIGNGVAGNSAALTARRLRPEMSIMILGKEVHPEYAAPALPDYLSGELSKEKILVKTFEDYITHNIQLRLNDEVTIIDPDRKTVSTAGGEEFSYGKLIVATGSFPIRLHRMKGTTLPGNFVLKTIDDVEAIVAYPGKHAVVVGSGAIGLEGGLALKERGYERVTVVEALDWISMRSFDKETAGEVVKALRSNGLEVYSGESVMGVEGNGRVQAVRTSRRVIPCDLILWGIGVRPQVELARKTGIALGELGGIRVDSHMRTNLPDIYACGDCTESPDRLSGKPALNLFWEPAARGGMVAGANCAGQEKEFTGSMAVFLTYIGQTPVVAFGKTEQDLKGLDYQVLASHSCGGYRRVLLYGGRIAGAQFVNTMDGVTEMLDQLQKGAPIPWETAEAGDSGKYAALQRSLTAYIQQLEAPRAPLPQVLESSAGRSGF
ncbi:MAG: NAD(P)/FAD-dependent oxidoreductase [Oscillibacter sp.]|nr:NAD(P)/FAD-dependent oxidoreductase [Oscillibacter sp.]